jgi:hypothetical protein
VAKVKPFAIDKTTVTNEQARRRHTTLPVMARMT